jgi:hypothetical protein
MELFEITEGIRSGIRIVRDGEPHLHRPSGCPLDIRLHPQLIGVIEEVDKEGPGLRLARATLDFAPNNLLLLKKAMPQGAVQQQVLVYIGTAGGVGGKAYLTANVFEEQIDQGRVRKRPSSFPSLGVQALCTDEELARVRAGVDILDVIVILNPGANCCIRRSGALEGAHRLLTVRWNGAWLSIDQDLNSDGSPRAWGARVDRASGFRELTG